ncbi:Vacuolar protein sorting-associated protein 53 [Neolecta irregularis DAH-3]|uniref:Vacuolar protein sorting-associated protein 53 n=1 Tax=Neolecta irregularis (strain DAH-3) TaxID=1198029 RepID=A0A1U7LNH2_NEOID|nr:Vacuolar protein sorting-associated protein 53 [Neolecta irregularis DAH-3]|eukprot:OLL24178.1 Vacuolar protein sorting-associated protein 53 [Neolecta irregularis DAH-3]
MQQNDNYSLDASEYDPISHINALFPSSQALTNIPLIQSEIRRHQDALQSQIADFAKDQQISDQDLESRSASITSDLEALLAKLAMVRTRSKAAEDVVAGLTGGIKRLDHGKKNLISSMNTLKRLQMLTTAYEQLLVHNKTRQFKETAHLLQVVMQLMSHFKSFRGIDQIATLSRQISDLQRDLMDQISDEFAKALSRSEFEGNGKATLAESCRVIDVLGDSARDRIITWYCNTQLKEYRSIFRGSDEAGSLDNISRRYAWLKRLLKTYDDVHAEIFPPHWAVSEALCRSFCESTRLDLTEALSGSMTTLNVELLLNSLRQTLEFEMYLEKKIGNDIRISIDTNSSFQAPDRVPIFGKPISVAFEPHLSLYIDAQEQSLSKMMLSFRTVSSADDEDQNVLSSSADLFIFYRQTFSQCAKLSTSTPLINLARLFAKYLQEYSDKILLQQLSGAVVSIPDACKVLNTADYCNVTASQLAEHFESRVDDPAQIDFQKEIESFMAVVGSAIRVLVKKIISAAEMPVREMANTDWSDLQNTGDQSRYIVDLSVLLQSHVEQILPRITKERYVRTFCDKLVEGFIATYINNIVKCKPISEIGAEQMLVDVYALKKTLLELPNLGLRISGPAPPLYVKFVNKNVLKVESLLKVILTTSYPAEGLVQSYFIHVGDYSLSNFQKILELKANKSMAVPKKDHSVLISAFESLRHTHTNLIESSSLLTPISITAPITLKDNSRFDHLITQSFLGDRLPTRSASESGAKLNENLRRLFRMDTSLATKLKEGE